MMRDLIQDFRFAIRQLFKNKTFTVISVTTLALAVGANTAIFSVVHTVLLGSLPYKHIDRLAMIWGRNTSRGDLQFPISAGDFTDWKQKNDAFEDIAASYDDAMTLTGQGEPRIVLAYAVTPNYLSILGTAPEIGRGFTDEEARSKAQIAYSVVQRTREIGIRMALGALRQDVLLQVLREGMKLVLAGEIAGLLIGLLVTRLASGVLFGVSPQDPMTFLTVTLILSSVALLASYVPAHRATKIEPLEALRYE